MTITDLTGTKWALGETVTIDSASIQNYAINYSVEVNENQDTPPTLTGGTSFDIVYSEYLTPRDAYVPVAYITINTEYSSNFGGAIYQSNGRIFEGYNQTLPAVAYRTDATSITYVTAISITGGTDATNANLISWLQANATQIIEPTANEYTITHSLTNVNKGNITLQLTPDTGYELPDTISVSNGTLVSYDKTTGIAVISGDDNTSVSAECVASAPKGGKLCKYQ